MYNKFNNMNINTFQKKIKIKIPCLVLLTVATFACAFAQGSTNKASMNFSDSNIDPATDKNLGNTLQNEARFYRGQGVEQQRMGNLDAAMSFYQKAVTLDPAYAVPYNDLGIIYEANGEIDRAERSYLQAVTIDPNYASAYSNLALLSENKRDLEKAAYYWGKRVELSNPSDPWTEKARQRLKDIKVATSGSSKERENDVLSLVTDVSKEKDLERTDNKVLARKYLEKAKQIDKKGDGITALKLATDAQQLDPTNDEIEKFAEDLQLRLLSQ